MTTEVPEPLDGRPVFDSFGEAKADQPTGRHVVRTALSLWVVYTVDERLTRLDGPAATSFRPSGQVEREVFYLNGEVHRPDGPAKIDYATDGKNFSAKYFRTGAGHRINGPAFYSTRNPERTGWMMFNINFDSRGRAYEWALGGGSNRCHGAIVGTEFDVLLPELDPTPVIETLASGVTTVAGVRAALIDGSPLEWVLAFEAGGEEKLR